MEADAMVLVLECWILSQLFHSPLSLSSRVSLVPLNFLPLKWYNLYICGGKKDLDADKDWRQEEKGMTEDEMEGWYHWLNGHKFEQAPGYSEG